MKRRGFTLIEISVVLLIVALFAAATVPNIASTIETGKRRSFKQSVLSLIRQAREESLSRGVAVDLASNSDSGLELIVRTDNEDNVIKQIDPIDSVQLQNFSKSGQLMSESDWRLTFYPDGTADSGSFEFAEGSTTRGLLISKKNGAVTLTDGEVDLNQVQDQEWQAGQFETSN